MPDLIPVPGVFARKSDPACVRAKPWTFKAEDEDGNTGLTSLETREMFVPMDDSTEALGVRQHEMLHVAMSPMPAGGMDIATLAAEDGRIESIATAKGLRREPVLAADDVSTTLLNAACQGMFPVSCLGVAVVGSPQESMTREVLGALGLKMVTDLMDRARDAYAADGSWASTEKVAGWLRELQDDDGGQGEGDDEEGDGEGEEGKGKESQKDKPKSKSKGAGSGTGKPKTREPAKPLSPMAHKPKSKPMETREAAEPEKATDDENREDGIKAFDMAGYQADSEEMFGKGDFNDWAEPYLETPPRTIRLAEVAGKGRGKASDVGTVPKRLSRMTIDQKIFGASRHHKKGTVLLDLSGSTSYLREVVPDVIRQIPAAVVAGYWGEDGTGVLRVLAANGKMVDPAYMEPDGTGNEIDGPAIAWLAAQQTPRVWLFDGGATGSGDDGRLTNEMRKELDYYQTTGRIHVIDPHIGPYDRETGRMFDSEEATERLVTAITKAMR